LIRNTERTNHIGLTIPHLKSSFENLYDIYG
jgi:hypothetical protein